MERGNFKTWFYFSVNSKQPTHPKYCGGNPTPPAFGAPSVKSAGGWRRDVCGIRLASARHRHLLYQHLITFKLYSLFKPSWYYGGRCGVVRRFAPAFFILTPSCSSTASRGLPGVRPAVQIPKSKAGLMWVGQASLLV